MNRRVTVALVLSLVVLIVSLFLIRTKSPSPVAPQKSVVATPTSTATRPSASPKDEQSTPSYSQLPAVDPEKHDPQSPQWAEWRRRSKEDKKWEWRTPILFYGRIVDQNEQPVACAEVNFQWTDLSASGTSTRQTISDQSGLFKLEGVQGKNLGVQIHKDGYICSELNRRSFEYAAFFDTSYYLPDANNPVVFRMQKRMPSEPLVKQSAQVTIPQNGSVGLNLLNGQKDAANGHVFIQLLDNVDRTGKRWAARIDVPNGGIQPANEEFATVAPDNGYMPAITIDQDTKQKLAFQGDLYKGGRFFVKTPVGYGLFEIRMIPGNPDFRFTSRVNPNLNSRNLEEGPDK